MDPREVVLVTGCCSELGHALCERLHRKKDEDGRSLYRVFAADLNGDGMADLDHHGIDTIDMDVTQAQSVVRAVKMVLKETGRIDVVICNVGIITVGPVAEQRLEDARRLLDINVLGVFRVVQAVVPSMMERRKGVIMITSSVTAHLTTPFGGLYSGSQACLHNMTEALRMEVSPWDVKVVMVELGALGDALSQNAIHQFPSFGRPGAAYKAIFSARMREKLFYLRRETSVRDTNRAVDKIVRVFERKSPPCRVHAGGESRKYKFLGFVQSWLAPGVVRRSFTRICGLDDLRSSLTQRDACNALKNNAEDST